MIDKLARELVSQAITAVGGQTTGADNTTLDKVLPKGTKREQLGFEISRRVTGISLPVPDLAWTVGALVEKLTLRIPPKLFYCSATEPPHVVTNPDQGRCPDHHVKVTSASYAGILDVITRDKA